MGYHFIATSNLGGRDGLLLHALLPSCLCAWDQFIGRERAKCTLQKQTLIRNVPCCWRRCKCGRQVVLCWRDLARVSLFGTGCSSSIRKLCPRRFTPYGQHLACLLICTMYALELGSLMLLFIFSKSILSSSLSICMFYYITISYY